jgi:HEAT repeat protein
LGITEAGWKRLTMVAAFGVVLGLALLPSWSPLSVTSDDDGVQEDLEFDEDILNDFPNFEDEVADSELEEGLEEGDFLGVLEEFSEEEPDGQPEATPTVPPAGSDDELLARLIEETSHPVWITRRDAINALGALGDTRAIPALVERGLYDDDSRLRWRSTSVLKSLDVEGDATIGLLIEGLEDSDPLVAHNAAVALAFFSRSEGLVKLMEGLVDPEPFRRWEAVFSLGRLDDEQVASAVTPLLDQGIEVDARVRGEVALLLGRIGGPESGSQLLQALRNDVDPEVRWRAASALVKVGDGSMVKELEVLLEGEENPQVRQHIGDAIARLS